MKFCRGCSTDKPIEEFHRNKNMKDGLHVRCKECVKLYAIENTDEITIRRRQEKELKKASAPPKVPKAPKLRKMAWACEHTDRPHGSKGFCTPCYDYIRYWKNADKVKERVRKKRANNPELFAEQLRRRKERQTEEKKEKNKEISRKSKKEAYKENPQIFIKRVQARSCANKEEKSAYDKRRRVEKHLDLNFKRINDYYQIDKNTLIKMFSDQSDGCPCGVPFGELFPTGRRKTWVVDHDHDCCPGEYCCGKCVRALLCSRCNLVLGALEEDPRLLPQYLIDYLEPFRYIKENTCPHPLLNSVLTNLQLSVKNTAKEPRMLNSRCLLPNVSVGTSSQDNTLYFSYVPPKSGTLISMPPSMSAKQLKSRRLTRFA